MRKYLWLIFRLGPYLLFCYFWIFRYSRHPERYSTEEKYRRVQNLLRKSNHSLRGDLIIEGKENIPEDEILCIIPNHLSNYDVIALIILFNQPITYVAKDAIKKYPYIGRLLKILGGELMNRDDLKQELRVMRNVKKSLDNNEKSWVIFPEGTRNRDYQNVAANTFKQGTFRIPLETKKTIVPIAIYGSFRVLSTKHHLRRYPVHIRVLPPVTASQFADMNSAALSEKVHSQISQNVSELRILDENYFAKRKKAK